MAEPMPASIDALLREIDAHRARTAALPDTQLDVDTLLRTQFDYLSTVSLIEDAEPLRGDPGHRLVVLSHQRYPYSGFLPCGFVAASNQPREMTGFPFHVP